MLYLGDILKFIVDRFDEGPFAKHNFVRHRHQRVLHVVFNLGNELEPVHEQKLKQLFANISLVTTEFAFDILDEGFRVKRLTVIHVAGSEHEVQYFTPIIYDQMQFEPEEPSHRALASFGYTFECLVYKYALMFADS